VAVSCSYYEKNHPTRVCFRNFLSSLRTKLSHLTSMISTNVPNVCYYNAYTYLRNVNYFACLYLLIYCFGAFPASTPVCDVHMSLTESETQVRCRVDFSGNWNSSIECAPDISGQVSVTGVPLRSVEYLKRFFNDDSFVPVNCRIFFDTLYTGRESASSTPSTYSYNWTIPFRRRSTMKLTTAFGETS